MNWVETVNIISIWGIFILSICDFIIVIIANHHPKYSKNKLLYEKLMLPVTISIPFFLAFTIFWSLPVFFTNEVPMNIKSGLIVLYIGSMGFVIWGVKHNYSRYKELVKKESNSSVERDNQ